MPDVVGKNLDTASGELDSKGIQYALNSNGKHVISIGAFALPPRQQGSP
jgi:hypothetical protein